MDSQFAFASRDDLWRLQNEMKSVYATQAEHSDRLLRLERRQEDDNRMKSVWGTSSPFPSILSGTPQQDSIYNPAAEAFKNFDQDQTSNLLGSLHLDTEEEPRRGASRANSVRFDESALHGHLTHASRSSSDFFPVRTGSGLGSHPMTERSSSHKSEGRQSSAGQSIHSTRLNSLGYEVRPPILTNSNPIGPPPGLFILGPLPSIIRCWLDTNYSTESLLYAAVCTGSYKSVLSTRLVSRLGLNDHLEERNGEQKIKMQVYLPEATIQQASLRSASPAPQLPALTIEFTVQQMPDEVDAIQVFLGSDLLRARSADLLFSQDRMTIYDDDRTKLAVPFVRPENSTVFQNLLTINTSMNDNTSLNVQSQSLVEAPSKSQDMNDTQTGSRSDSYYSLDPGEEKAEHSSRRIHPPFDTSAKESSDVDVGSAMTVQESSQSRLLEQADDNAISDSLTDAATPDTPTRTENGNIWGSWRRDSTQYPRPDSTFSSVAAGSGYQRAGRGRGMKVLKPTRSSTSSRSVSVAQAPVGFGSAPSRSQENGTRVAGAGHAQASGPPKRSVSIDSKSPIQPAPYKSRPANPIGGASAFGWLNSSQQKQTSAATE